MAKTSHGHYIPGTLTLGDDPVQLSEGCGELMSCEICMIDAIQAGYKLPEKSSEAVRNNYEIAIDRMYGEGPADAEAVVEPSDPDRDLRIRLKGERLKLRARYEAKQEERELFAEESLKELKALDAAIAGLDSVIFHFDSMAQEDEDDR